ncbi:MAG: methionine--tRNA ligase subunit beta, partial [Bacteroidota bacterium]
WKLFKAEPDSPKIKECMYVSLQITALLSALSAPFIPFTSAKLRTILQLDPLENGELQKVLDQLDAHKSILPGGHQIGQPELLFAKIHDRKDSSRLDIINRQKAKLESILEEEQPKHVPLKETIQYDDFAKLDLRTGTIIEAEKMPKADKLLKLTVDLGFEKRTVVSGIAQHYEAADIIGQKVLLLANLAARKLRGVPSQGMILMAEDADGKLHFVAPAEGSGNGDQIS